MQHDLLTHEKISWLGKYIKIQSFNRAFSDKMRSIKKNRERKKGMGIMNERGNNLKIMKHFNEGKI